MMNFVVLPSDRLVNQLAHACCRLFGTCNPSNFLAPERSQRLCVLRGNDNGVDVLDHLVHVSHAGTSHVYLAASSLRTAFKSRHVSSGYELSSVNFPEPDGSIGLLDVFDNCVGVLGSAGPAARCAYSIELTTVSRCSDNDHSTCQLSAQRSPDSPGGARVHGPSPHSLSGGLLARVRSSPQSCRLGCMYSIVTVANTSDANLAHVDHCVLRHIIRALEHDCLVADAHIQVIRAVVHDTRDVEILLVDANHHLVVLVVPVTVAEVVNERPMFFSSPRPSLRWSSRTCCWYTLFLPTDEVSPL